MLQMLFVGYLLFSYEQVGSLALQEVGWDWKTSLPDWSISFYPERDGYLAMT